MLIRTLKRVKDQIAFLIFLPKLRVAYKANQQHLWKDLTYQRQNQEDKPQKAKPNKNY